MCEATYEIVFNILGVMSLKKTNPLSSRISSTIIIIWNCSCASFVFTCKFEFLLFTSMKNGVVVLTEVVLKLPIAFDKIYFLKIQFLQ